MDFFPTGDNVLNPVNTGEAPTLSSTYGGYDNGANVFNFCDNFAGTSLSSKWIESGITSSNIAVNNGLTMNANGLSPAPAGWSTAGIIAASENLYGTNAVVETYASVNGINNDARVPILLNSNARDESTIANTIVAGIMSAPMFGVQFSPGQEATEPITSFSASTSYIFGITSVGTSVTAFINYVNASSTYQQYGATAIYPAFGFGESPDPNIQVTWVRVRAYPPNGVMPLISFGGIS
jgi:hypothetical protein